MNYLEHLHSLDNELKNKFRKLESIHLKIINTKWSHTFNEVCLKENHRVAWLPVTITLSAITQIHQHITY